VDRGCWAGQFLQFAMGEEGRVDRFVLHDNDKEEERRQKRRKKANGASLDSKAAKSLKSVMWGKVVEFTP
jgi:hypothetical protein